MKQDVRLRRTELLWGMVVTLHMSYEHAAFACGLTRERARQLVVKEARRRGYVVPAGFGQLDAIREHYWVLRAEGVEK